MTAAIATATATATNNVHITIPGAAAFSEFQGYHDDCGPNAEIMALHLCPWDGLALSGANLNNFRSQYIAAGRWGGGTTLSNILWHLQSRHAHIRPGMIPYSGKPNYAALHSYIKQEILRGNPVIIQVLNAQALSHNERGVKSHFVTLAGIDSAAGYLTLNGDTTDALGGAHLIIPAYWNTWAQLVAAQVCGAIALDRSAGTATPIPTPVAVTPPASPASPTATPAAPVSTGGPITSALPLPLPPPIGLSDAISACQALLAALQKMQAS